MGVVNHINLVGEMCGDTLCLVPDLALYCCESVWIKVAVILSRSDIINNTISVN